MNIFFKILIVGLVFSVVMHADERYKIVVGSYSYEYDYSRAIDNLNDSLQSNEELKRLLQKYNFYTDVQESGNYHIVVLEPFEDKKVLAEVLNVVRKIYDGAFSAKMKPVVIENEDQEAELQAQEVEENATVAEQRVEQNIQQPVAKGDEDKKPLIIQEETELQAKVDIASNKKTMTEDGLFAYAVFAMTVLVLLFVIEVLRRKNKLLRENEHFFYSNDVQANFKNFHSIEMFLSKVSDQLRDPLNDIVQHAKELERSMLNTKDFHSVVVLKDAAKRSLNVVDDILDATNLSKGILHLDSEMFDINDVLVDISNSLSHKANDKGLELVYFVDHSVPALFVGDKVRVGQIFINLIENAIKHTQKGRIEFYIDTIKEQYEQRIGLEFSVIDQGVGFDSKTASELFTKQTHLGLSLFIVKNLVEAMDGSIVVNSAKNIGTEFIVKLYLNKNNVTERRFYRLPSRELMRKNVVVLDDHEHSTKSLKNMLEYFQYDVRIAQSFDEFQSMQDDKKAHMFFVDESYAKTLEKERLLELKTQQDLKIIYMHTEEDVQSIDANVYDNNLLKPFNQGMIFNLILNLYPKVDQEEDVLENIEDASKEEEPFSFLHLDIQEGLKNCDNSINTYVSLLEDFINMYANAHDVMQEMIQDKRDEDAQTFIEDLKNLANYLGGSKLAKNAQEIQEVFSQQAYNKLPVLVSLFSKNIEKIIVEMQEYKNRL